MPKEIGGPSELEPTRYGDWERKGITSDFEVYFLKFYILNVNKNRAGFMPVFLC